MPTSKPIPEFEEKPTLKREVKKLLKYPNGIYLLSVGRIIPQNWKEKGETIVEIEVLESSLDYVILKLKKVESEALIRWREWERK